MRRGQSGFSLTELSIVIAITGILLAAAVAAYAQYYRYQQIKTTRDNIVAAQEAIQQYQQNNGFYPCPADPAGKDLKATNCAAAATGAVRVVDLGGGKRVRIGAMPMLDLSGNTKLIPGSGALDGFRRRLTYAVTESQAISQAAFSTSAGAITIKSAEGAVQTSTANFLILSHGEDGLGAHTAMGNAGQPCGTGTIDSENCNGDAIFAVRSPGEAASFAQGNATYNDDFADYGTATATAATGELGRFKTFAVPVPDYSSCANIGGGDSSPYGSATPNGTGMICTGAPFKVTNSLFDTAHGCFVDYLSAGGVDVCDSAGASWSSAPNVSTGKDIMKVSGVIFSAGYPTSLSAYAYGNPSAVAAPCCKYFGGPPVEDGIVGSFDYDFSQHKIINTKTGR